MGKSYTLDMFLKQNYAHSIVFHCYQIYVEQSYHPTTLVGYYKLKSFALWNYVDSHECVAAKLNYPQGFVVSIFPSPAVYFSVLFYPNPVGIIYAHDQVWPVSVVLTSFLCIFEQLILLTALSRIFSPALLGLGYGSVVPKRADRHFGFDAGIVLNRDCVPLAPAKKWKVVCVLSSVAQIAEAKLFCEADRGFDGYF